MRLLLISAAVIVNCLLSVASRGASEVLLEVPADSLRVYQTVLPVGVLSVDWGSPSGHGTIEIGGDLDAVAKKISAETGFLCEADHERHILKIFRDSDLKRLMSMDVPATTSQIMVRFFEAVKSRVDDFNRSQNEIWATVVPGEYTDMMSLSNLINLPGDTAELQSVLSNALSEQPRLFCTVIVRKVEDLPLAIRQRYPEEVLGTRKHVATIQFGIRGMSEAIELTSLQYRTKAVLDPKSYRELTEKQTTYVVSMLSSDKEEEREKGRCLFKLCEPGDQLRIMNSVDEGTSAIVTLRLWLMNRFYLAGRGGGDEMDILKYVVQAGHDINAWDRAEIAVTLAMIRAPSAVDWFAATSSDIREATATEKLRRRYAEAAAILCADRGDEKGKSAARNLYEKPSSAVAVSELLHTARELKERDGKSVGGAQQLGLLSHQP